MKTRQKRLVTSAGALFVALYALATAPTAALAPAAGGSCSTIGGCVGYCDEDMCNVYGCSAVCLKAGCADGTDAFVCQS